MTYAETINFFKEATPEIQTQESGGAKVVGGIWNAITDVTIDDGVKSGFLGNKNNGRIMVDGIFEVSKTLFDEMGAMGGVSEIHNKVAEITIDQVQTEANELLDKVTE